MNQCDSTLQDSFNRLTIQEQGEVHKILTLARIFRDAGASVDHAFTLAIEYTKVKGSVNGGF